MLAALLAAALIAWAPPPAYANGVKLAQSSFCWGAICADFVAYKCGDKDVPNIRVARGSSLTLRFGFVPTSVHLGVGRRSFQLPARQRTTWRVTRSGYLYVFATARTGDSTYVGCIRPT